MYIDDEDPLALHMAVRDSDEGRAVRLLQERPDLVQAVDQVPFVAVCVCGVCRSILTKLFVLFCFAQYRWTPLHLAALYNSPLCQLLIDAGADVFARDQVCLSSCVLSRPFY